MTITNVTDEDGGEYLVQFDGLRVYPYDQVCERQTLSMLRQYPLLAPAVLLISTDGEKVLVISLFMTVNVTQIITIGGNIKMNKQPSSVLVLKHKQLFNSSTPVSLGVTIDQYAADESTAVYWYHNGGSSPSTASSIRKLVTQAELNIQLPTILHTGVYETQLRINYRSSLNCDKPSRYHSFFYNFVPWWTVYVVIGSDVQQLLYSGKK